MQRRVYCVGLRKHVEADIDDIVPITGKRGTKYQCIGKYSENGKDYVVKSWVPKADYEALHGAVDISAAEEFIGADVEAAEPLAADPVADSPVAEDSSEPLEVAPADKSYFLSETVVLSAIKEMAAEGEEPPETITYDCISCGEEIDDEDGHELVGEFQEKCCLPCFKTAFGAEDECSSCKDTGISDYYAPCELCMGNMEFDDIECRKCHGSGASDRYAPCEECSDDLPHFYEGSAEQTFEAQQKDRKDETSERAARKLITNSYGVKRIVSGPTYYRFVAGTSSKFLMFAVVERNNGTYQAVNVWGRRGAQHPTLWTSDVYSTQSQAERVSSAKQNKKMRTGYVFLDAEEFTAFMAEHFDSETLNSRESIDNYMSESMDPEEWEHLVDIHKEWFKENADIYCVGCQQLEGDCDCPEFVYMDAESPLDESPVDEDPLTADPSDMGGPEDFSADATIDLEDGEITIHEKGAKSGSKKKLLLGVILVAGLAAAYQNSDAVLEFFEGLKGDEADPILGCMDETANNYDATATEDDGTCTYDPDDEATA